MSNYKETRPWGEFENLLDAEFCKVKRITVNPGQSPSYQYHHKRAEVWTIVQGNAVITLDDVEQEYKNGDVIQIGVGMKHRVKNQSEAEELIFIEVQTGTYFGEDDIVRLEDNYGRA